MMRRQIGVVLGVGLLLPTLAAAQGSVNVRATDPNTNLTRNVGDSSNNALRVNIVAGAAAGGTSSSFGTSLPSAGTAAGFSDGTNMQAGRVFDVDTGGGTQYALGINLRRAASGGSQELIGQGTMSTSLPVTIASDQSAVPVAQSGGWSMRAQDGSGNALTSLSVGAQRAMTVAIVDASGAQITSFGGAGGTASNFGSAFPTPGTATGFSDGTNMQGARVVDADTGAGTVYTLTGNLVRRASGGPVELVGQGTMATSLPVVIASDQTALPLGTLSPGSAATNLGKLEDALHVSGDLGVMLLGVRQSTPTDLSAGATNGDYVPPQYDASGRMWTNPFPTSPAASTYLPIRISDGSAFLTPSTDYTHDTALTMATSAGPLLVARASAAAPTDVGADTRAVGLWALRSGALATQLTAGGALIGGDATLGLKVQCMSGCAGSGGTSSADRSAFVAGTTAGTLSMAVRDDTSPATVNEDLAGAVRMSTNRELYGVIRDAAGNNRGANVDASGNLSVTFGGNPGINVAQIGGGTASTVATGILRVGIADSGGNSYVSAANALNSTGTGILPTQHVAQFDDTAPTAITENQFGNVRMSANRNQYGVIRDSAGNERGANVNASNELLVALSTLPASANLIGDVNLRFGGTASAVNLGTTNAQTQRVVLSTDNPIQPGWGQGVLGSAPPVNAQYIAGRSGAVLAPIPVCDLQANLKMTTATTTQIVAFGSGSKIYVCYANLLANGTTTGKFVYGTGTNCGTGTADITPAYDLTAQAGWSGGSGIGAIMDTPTSNSLCVTNSAAQNLSAFVRYTVY